MHLAFVIAGGFFVAAKTLAFDFEIDDSVGEDAVLNLELGRLASSEAESRHEASEQFTMLFQFDSFLKTASATPAAPAKGTVPSPGALHAQMGALGCPIEGLLFTGPIGFDLACDGVGVPFAAVSGDDLLAVAVANDIKAQLIAVEDGVGNGGFSAGAEAGGAGEFSVFNCKR